MPSAPIGRPRSEEHTSELQSQSNLVCRLLLEKKHPVVSEIWSQQRTWRQVRPQKNHVSGKRLECRIRQREVRQRNARCGIRPLVCQEDLESDILTGSRWITKINQNL